jgi:hypothetical protein
VDEDFLEYCESGALSVEVYGHKEQGTLSLREIHDQVYTVKKGWLFFRPCRDVKISLTIPRQGEFGW